MFHFRYHIQIWILVLLLLGCLRATTQPVLVSEEQIKMQLIKSHKHPRLFIDNENIFTDLKKRTDSTSLQMMAIMLHMADGYLTAPDIEYPSKGFKMSAVRQVQGRLLSLCMAYRITGKSPYLKHARKELMQLSALPDWCPGHFLDVGEASLAAAVGYDWLYYELTTDERQQVLTAIKKNALLPSLQVKDEGTWVTGDFNWAQVCHAGLTAGALMIAEQEPALSSKVIARAINNIRYAGATYTPDGSYAEGPSYWSYGTSFHVMLIEMLRSSLGSSFGLETFEGFLKTADYRLQMVSPTGLDFNYSDYHAEYQNEPVFLWFARETDRPELASGEITLIRDRYQLLKSTIPSSLPLRINRHLPLGLLWYKPQPDFIQRSPSLHWTADGVLPLAVMRTAWNDKRASYIAIKGGTPDHSHGHMDIGSFVLEANGVRWALDLGTESYDKMRAAKLDLWNYSQESNRWTTFRVGPEGHNILRFNDERQEVDGKGTITILPEGNDVDLSSLYKKWTQKVHRRVLLHADKSMSVEDEWTTADAPVETSFQWLTKAVVTRHKKGVVLEQEGEKLELIITSPGADWTLDIQDVSKSTQIQDSPNPGLSRIVIKLKTAAFASNKLMIKIIPLNK